MKNKNKKIGNDFEKTVCEILAKEGFWVHNFAQKVSGQPADIIAVKNSKAKLIDCKVCSDNARGFALGRIEENQELSMVLWKECGNGDGWFAILFDGDIYMIPHTAFAGELKAKSTLSPRDIREYGISIEKWVSLCE